MKLNFLNKNDIFNLYDITNKIVKKDSVPVKISGIDIKKLILSKEDISKNEYRQNYIKILFNFFENLKPKDNNENKSNENKSIDSLQYKVTSKNVKMTNNQIKNIHSKIMAQKQKTIKNKENSVLLQQKQSSQQLQTPENQKLQQQIQLQQEQINHLKKKDKNRWGLGTYLAADVGVTALFNLF